MSDGAQSIRKKWPRFRILVIGRGNAGKTTILKKVCDTTDDPMIFSPSGKKIDPSVISPSAERGIHDINNEMVFKSNPEFVFHDSRGFKCGSVDETEAVKTFLTKRAASSTLAEQLHAIWYCLPTDTDRPLLAADEIFFNECGMIGKAPVIAIFTKFDGLVTTSFNSLRGSCGIKEAKKQAAALAETRLRDNFEMPLKATKYPPKAFLHLRDMQRATTNCSELIEKTADAIDSDALKLVFVSVQQNNIDLCVRSVLRDISDMKSMRIQDILRSALEWFQHTWRHHEYDRSFSFEDEIFNQNVRATDQVLNEKQGAFATPGSDVSFRLNVLAAVLICTEQTFSEASAWGESFAEAFVVALGAYVASGLILRVQDSIAAISAGRVFPLGSQPTSRWDTQKMFDAGTAAQFETLIKETRLRIHQEAQ